MNSDQLKLHYLFISSHDLRRRFHQTTRVREPVPTPENSLLLKNRRPPALVQAINFQHGSSETNRTDLAKNLTNRKSLGLPLCKLLRPAFSAGDPKMRLHFLHNVH